MPSREALAHPVHTPYDGSSKPFSIGLKPLDLTAWFEIDQDLGRYQGEKERLWADNRHQVYAQTEGSLPAQNEALRLISRQLPIQRPDIYQRAGELMRVSERVTVDLADDASPPLWRAARLVPDDLVIMQKHDDGWRLTAASLSFPSSWSLREKFDRPIQDIHETVPAFGRGTRNAMLIDRIFDNLQPDHPVWRLNWSIYPDDRLHHPKTKTERGSDFVPQVEPGSTFIRVEKQTLHRLPQTGAILFTIRIYVDPLTALLDHGEGERLARGLRQQLEALDAEQIDYKGLAPRRAALIAALSRIEQSS
ncbi:heme-dependent oxidative N-demethylase family protein [Pararhizobium haloflavum]|uniref:heme-dependent oxidative N-demethylase family protein n=1 Tax=Pararhizobium haloflavum TaxID=2037914 RepID=UPI000C183A1E|nr:DUF3445 domain-containing protein [Pararhizobium haloflavum]